MLGSYVHGMDTTAKTRAGYGTNCSATETPKQVEISSCSIIAYHTQMRVAALNAITSKSIDEHGECMKNLEG